MITKSGRRQVKVNVWLSPATGALGAMLIVVALLMSGTWTATASALNQAQEKQPEGIGTTAARTDDVTYPLQEGFESGSLPLSRFHSVVPTCVPGSCGWATVTNYKHSGSYAAFASGIAGVADQQLTLDNSIFIPADASAVTLTFWQRYDFEVYGSQFRDGAVLEVSTNGGTTWSDSGIQFASGGYNATITGTGNPLAGRQGWGGTTGGAFAQAQANLLSYAGYGVLIRFRAGSDNNNAVAGWWVDDVVLAVSTPTPCASPAWSVVAPYPMAVSHHAAVALDGRLYVFGGLDDTGTSLAVAYKYNPATNNWSVIAPLPSARSGAAAVTDGTYIYIIGGVDEADDPTRTLWRYDPATNSYLPLASYATATTLHASVLLNGEIYRIAGSTLSFSINSVEVYDIAANTWSGSTDYPLNVRSLKAVAYGGYIYAAGGFDGNGGGAKSKTYRFDPNTATWNDAAMIDLPQPRYGAASELLNGRWVIAAGTVNSSISNTVLAWNPATNTWTSLPATMHATHLGASGVIGQSLHIVGGQSAPLQHVSHNQRYQEVPCVPFTATPALSTTPTPGGPTVTPNSTNTPGGEPTTCPVQFTDVPSNHTFYAYIRCLACRGIVGGYADGTFRPANDVTRGQIAKIVSNAAGFSEAHTNRTFEDIPTGHTFYPYIERLASRGVIGGYACGGAGEPCGPANLPYFRSNNNASRGQLAKIVANAAGLGGAVSGQRFEDVPPTHTFYEPIERLAGLGVMSGYVCGGVGEPCLPPGNGPYFRPANNVTRGQTAKIVGNTFFPNCIAP